jgi:hypothetical protein
MSDEKSKTAYEATLTTPDQDLVLDELRASLTEWLIAQANKGVNHSLVLTSLMLFTASGVAPTTISKEAFIDMMGRYYDIYRMALGAQS